ncbi:MAG TPA: iron-containing alcohol dehydrogenase, partial [Victivallales bacterium]|nr:iron-containing alcohol dehydrogenase [Victivallales bacterium]
MKYFGYNLIYPQIFFSCASIQKAKEFFKDKSTVILITGKSALKNGLQEKLEKILSDLQYFSLCGIVGEEAPLESVDAIVDFAKKKNADAIFAVGGGSIIDAAKAASVVITNGGKCSDFFFSKRKITKKGLFLIAVPTTAGTGAEITENSVLIEKATMIKKSIRGKELIPDIAIIDPELTFSCPSHISAQSGMDALVQAIESFTSPESNTVSSLLAMKATKILIENLPDAVLGKEDAKISTAEGSLLSGMAFSHTGLGAVHGLAHPIGAKCSLPHGRVCGILMRTIFRENLKKINGLYDELARFCNCSDSEEFLNLLDKISERIGIPAKFADSNLKDEDFNFIIKNCRSRSMERNPYQYSDDEINEILKKL